MLAWRSAPLWAFFLGVVSYFVLLQVSARLILQLSFYQGTFTSWQAVLAQFYGARFDLRLACLAAGIPLVLGALPFVGNYLHPLRGDWLGVHRRGAWFWPSLGAALVTLWSFVAYTDFGNMAYWQHRLNVGVLYLLQDLDTNTQVLWDSYPIVWLSALSVLLAVVSYYLLSRLAKACLREQCHQNEDKRVPTPLLSKEQPYAARPSLSERIKLLITRPRILSGVANLALCLFVLFLIHGRWSQYPLRWSDLVALGHPPSEQLAINPVQNLADTLAYRKPQFDPMATRAAYPMMSSWLGVDQPDAKQLVLTRKTQEKTNPLVPKDANVVLVILESLSGYKTSMHGNKLALTPQLQKLVDQGWWFERFGSAHPLTARGVYSVITSRPDVAAGDTASRNPQAILHQSLIAAWSKHQAFYFIGGSTSWANVRGLLTKAVPGVKIYEEENYQRPRTDVWGLSDRNLFLESADILDAHTKEKQQPFFAVIQSAANHRPYTVPNDDTEFKVLTKPESELAENGIGGGNAEYNAIRLMDHSVGKFMERAAKSPWYQNTLFVFLGDHGTIGKVPQYMPGWMQASEMATIHTPLILYAPQWLKPQRFQTMGQQADLLPTLVELTGHGATNRGMGRSLIGPRPGQEGLFYNMQVGGLQYGWFDGRYFAKISDANVGANKKRALTDTPSLKPSGRLQLFDLSDPAKHHLDIAAQMPELAAKLGAHLEAYFQTARYAVMNP